MKSDIGTYIDPKIINITRGLCTCGKTNGNKYNLIQILNGKENPTECKYCGYEFPDVLEGEA